jgi:hypothetical protein
MKRLLVVACVVVVALVSTTTQAGVLFDRGLPNANVNAADASRSNVTWAIPDDTGFTGDDFTIGTVGQQYRIDSITVWGAQYNPLSTDINNISLYVGKAGPALSVPLTRLATPMQRLSTGSVTGNTDSNPNITHTYVNYPDGTAYYVGNGGTRYSICQTTFSGLNLLVDGGVKYDFGVEGDSYRWWNLASNAASSGTVRQDGADGLYLVFDNSDLGQVTVWDSATVGPDASPAGWDKSSDINVMVTGEAVPEPATIIIWSLLGGLGIVVAHRRKRAT